MLAETDGALDVPPVPWLGMRVGIGGKVVGVGGSGVKVQLDDGQAVTIPARFLLAAPKPAPGSEAVRAGAAEPTTKRRR